jgi:hypothetical protein
MVLGTVELASGLLQKRLFLGVQKGDFQKVTKPAWILVNLK